MAAATPAPPRKRPALWRRRWFLPLAVAVAVTLIGATVVAAVIATRPPSPANQAVAPAPQPTAPSPAPGGSPPPPSADQASQHQLYRAYVSTVIRQGTGLIAAMGGLAGCRLGRPTCVGRVNQAQEQVTAFQHQLAATPAPACLTTADELLRDGLEFQGHGLSLAGEAIQAEDRVRLAQGLLLVVAATWREGQAIAAGRRSQC